MKKTENNEIVIIDLENEQDGLADVEVSPKKTSSKAARIFDFIIPIVTGIVLVCGGLYLYNTNSEYRDAVNEYDDIQKIAISVETWAGGSDEESGPLETFRNLHIDFDKLAEINPDIVGWIFIPTLDNVNYPVLKSDDNEYYLKHTFEKEVNSSGAIFMDSQSFTDMADYNTFIYGHNMKNGSMFGQLKRFAKEEGLVDIDPYVFYYTKDHAYKYRIFAYYTTKNGSFTYNNPCTEEQYENYAAMISGVNEYEAGKSIGLSEHPNILTLSTCAGARTVKRTIVQAVLVDDYEISNTK